MGEGEKKKVTGTNPPSSSIFIQYQCLLPSRQASATNATRNVSALSRTTGARGALDGSHRNSVADGSRQNSIVELEAAAVPPRGFLTAEQGVGHLARPAV